jgi:L-threonylcarbamoyladenylate synthase
VKADLDGLISCILQGDPTDLGLESTVVDCTGEFPIVLRTGAVTLEALRAVAPETTLGSGDASVETRSPGLKYRHYAPAARVEVVESPAQARTGKTTAYIGLSAEAHSEDFRLHCVCASLEEYAHNLYHFFRACDEAGIEVIYCEAVDQAGLGLALMDRLRRASYR